MRAVALWVAAVLLAGCGARPQWPADADARAFTVPLVMAWRPTRLLVEVRIDRSPPMLMALDTTRETGVLPPDVARQLALPAVGDPTRGARVMAGRVELGDVELRGVPFAVEPGSHGLLFGRPVMGLLGTDWFAGRRMQHDPAAGVLRFVPAEVPPPVGGSVGIERDGAAWRVPASMAGVAIEPVLDTDTSTGHLTRGRAEAVLSAAGQATSVGVQVGGLTAHPGPWRLALDGPDTLSLTGLHGLGWRLDTAAERLFVWPAPDGPARFERFGPQPDCGPRLARCLSGRVDAVREGRVDLVFDEPVHHLAPRFWMRIDLGPPGRPYSALVQIRPRAPGTDGPLVAHLEDGRVRPERIRPVGAAVHMLDIVPGDHPCSGLICLHRQEGDAAELIMESSEPAETRSPDGVAPEVAPTPERPGGRASGRAPSGVERAAG